MAKKNKPAQHEREERSIVEDIEFREDDDAASIGGYAAVFNQETVIAGLFREQIAPGAFDHAIKSDDVRALFNHDPNILLGRTKSGTLRLSTDKRGLKYDVDLPDTSQARDVRELIRRGDVTGSSFGFTVDEDEWDESATKKGKLPLRTILRASLWDVSPVTYPAYPQTSVSARSMEKAQAMTEAAERNAAVVRRSDARAAVEQAKAWPAA